MIQGRTRRLADVQARQVEVGRIRLGTSTKKTSRAGREYNEPVKLERFRLTSRSEALIIQAAGLYGGEPEIWQPDHGAQQWQVVIDAKSLPVIVPPDACSQYYEQWSAGRCQRRCDGARELLEDLPCICGPDPDDKKRQGCKPTTRVSLMLAEMEGIGIWRLETHGYNAAAELPGVVDLLSAAGGNIPARLEMEERSAEVQDPRNPDKTIISRFMVPVLHVEATPAAIVGSFTPRAALEGGPQRAALPAAPDDDGPDEPPAEDPTRRFEQQIQQATSLDELKKISGEILQAQLPAAHSDRLRRQWLAHRDRLVAQEVPMPRSGPPAAPRSPQPPPAAGGPDRMQVWNEVNQLAGTKGLTMSGLKEAFGEFTGAADQPLTRADGPTLLRFKTWLEGRR